MLNETGFSVARWPFISSGTCPPPALFPAPVQARPVQRAGRGIQSEGSCDLMQDMQDQGSLFQADFLQQLFEARLVMKTVVQRVKLEPMI